MSNPLAGRVRKVALALAASGVASLAMSGPAMAGAFVVGDSPATTNPVYNQTQVYFWGSQWSQNNQLKNDAPSAFKGFARTIDPNSLSNCSTLGWATDPGTSTPPPAALSATLPNLVPGTNPLTGHQQVLVVTADTITKDSNTIVGTDSNGSKVYIVDVQSDYAPDAGHVGIGTIVAPYCTAADVATYGGGVGIGGSGSFGIQ
jgi:hypothetical protein